LLLEFGLLRDQPLGVLGERSRRDIRTGFGGGNEFRIVVARAQRFAGVRGRPWRRRRDHRKTGMRVMIEDGNLFNLREQSLVDLLHVRSGKRTGLAGCEGFREATRR
jgi:hypothetical protein